jgi:hypothetical protein
LVQAKYQINEKICGEIIMKMTKTFILASAFMAVTNAQAAAVSDMSIAINWNSLVISGPLGGLSSFTDPLTGVTFSSDAEGWAGSSNGTENYDSAINGASATATYSDSISNLTGGYDQNTNMSGGDIVISNSGDGVQSGWAGAYRGFIYQATGIGSGSVTVSVDYSLIGSVSTSSPGEYANGGYELYMDAVDADAWKSAYDSAFLISGDQDAAETAASNLVAPLDVYSFSNYQLIESSNCLDPVPCVSSVNQTNTLSLTFDVNAGTNYFFGADAGVSGYTDVSAVPVPAAVWLFGSGLIGLIGVARRKKEHITG